MIIVDVEATGVDAKLCSLLSVGAVDFDNPTNQFYAECYAFPGAHIEKEALEVNGFRVEEIIARVLQRGHDNSRSDKNLSTSFVRGDKSSASEDLGTSFRKGGIKRTDREVVLAFLEWMKTCKEWTLAGQNPSFDRTFLEETSHRYHINWPLAHRTVDLHSVAYCCLVRAGKSIPRKNNHSALNLESILEHVGLQIKRKTHNALEDAKLEAEAFSRLFKKKVLLAEFSDFPLPSF